METAGNPTPECECHGVEMLWNRAPHYNNGGFWKCRVKHREKARAAYEQMSSLEYNRILLRHRRSKALERRREREAS